MRSFYEGAELGGENESLARKPGANVERYYSRLDMSAVIIK